MLSPGREGQAVMGERQAVWRQPPFARLWAAQTMSLLGAQVSLLALPLTAVLVLRATPMQMGLLTSASFVPGLALGLVAGAWVDRVSRRSVLVAADLASALALATVPGAALLDRLEIGQLFLVALLTGTASTFFLVAYRSYLPSIVPARHLVDANGRLEASRAAAQLLGPAAAGVLIARFSPPLAVGADALLLTLAALLLASGPADEAPAAGARHALPDAMLTGVRYALADRTLRAILLCTATFSLSSSVVTAVLVLYATRQLHLTVAMLAAAFTAGSIGAFVGAQTVRWVTGRLGVGPTMAVATVVGGTSLLLVPLASWLPAAALLPLALGQLTLGVSTTLYNVNQLTLRQVIVPPSLQGRVNAAVLVAFWASQAFGAALGGALGSRLGLVPTLLLGALGALGSCLWVAASPVWRLRSLPSEGCK